jgi:hypothetical protein
VTVYTVSCGWGYGLLAVFYEGRRGGWRVINMGSDKDAEFPYHLLNRTSIKFLWCRIEREVPCNIHAFGFVFLTTAMAVCCAVVLLCCCAVVVVWRIRKVRRAATATLDWGSHLGHVWRYTQIHEPQGRGYLNGCAGICQVWAVDLPNSVRHRNAHAASTAVITVDCT